ncbi:MAG: ComEC/Rec2 family competence protein [Eubacteriales bacterium]|nr:ComEC/Rec2 family competence protein [Eubacteriales bacterium]
MASGEYTLGRDGGYLPDLNADATAPWRARRLLGNAVCLAVGVACGRWAGHAPLWGWLFFAAAAGCWLLWRRRASWLGRVASLALGAALVMTAWPAWAGEPTPAVSSWQGIVVETQQESGSPPVLILDDVCTADGQRLAGRVRLTDRTQGSLCAVGQRLQVEAKLNVPQRAAFSGGFDSYSYYLIEKIRFVSYTSHIAVVSEPTTASLTQRLRTQVRGRLYDSLPPTSASVLVALLTGDRSGVPQKLLEALTRAGVIHLLVVSGLHISLSAGLAFRLARRCRAPRWLAALVGVAVLGGYVLLTGWTASVIRAAVMWGVWVVGQLLGREYDAPSSWAAALFLGLCLDPLELFRAGFQLSYAAAGAILFLTPIAGGSPTENPFANKVLQALNVSFCAQLGTLPIMMTTFGTVAVLAPLINLAAVPLAFALLMAGAALLAVSEWPAVAQWLGGAVAWVSEPVLKAAAAWQGPVWYTAIPPVAVSVLYLLLLASLSPKVLCLSGRPRRAAAVLAGCMALLALSPVCARAQSPQPVILLREGNGISVVWREQGLVYVLCDTEAAQAAAYVKRAYGGRVDGLIVTGEASGALLEAFDPALVACVYVPDAVLHGAYIDDLCFSAQKAGVPTAILERLSCPVKQWRRNQYTVTRLETAGCTLDVCTEAPPSGVKICLDADVTVASFGSAAGNGLLAQRAQGAFVGRTALECAGEQRYTIKECGSIALAPGVQGWVLTPYEAE